MAQLDTSLTTSPTPAVEMLSNECRQAAIARLQKATQPMALADLAEDLTSAEQGRWNHSPDYDAVQRCALHLYHVHVPKLVDMGLVDYDTERRVVSLAG